MIVLQRTRSDYITSLTTAAAETPITLAEAKAHLRVDTSDDDSYITALINAATNVVEAQTGKALVSQTWEVSLPCPDGEGRFVLPVGPATSITSIAYYDADNASQAAVVDDFYFFKTEQLQYLEPKPDKNWPTLYSRPDALTVTFVAGFGAASAVPENLKHAIKLIIGDWHEVGGQAVVGAMTNEAPLAVPVKALIEPHRAGFVAS